MKVVVSDLDGTLLRSNRTISKRTLAVLQALHKANVTMAIATARPFRVVPRLLPSILSDGYLICYNGAEIYQGNTLVYHKYVDPVTSKDIVDGVIGCVNNVMISVEMNGCLYTNFDISRLPGWIPPYERVDFAQFEYDETAKILVDLSGIEDIHLFTAKLPASCSVTVTDHGTLAQITHSEVSKFAAVRHLADMLGCGLDEVVALGDDYNDLAIIRECGIGIAMGNAPAEIRQAADIVAATNDEDGAAMELEKLFLAG